MKVGDSRCPTFEYTGYNRKTFSSVENKTRKIQGKLNRTRKRDAIIAAFVSSKLSGMFNFAIF